MGSVEWRESGFPDYKPPKQSDSLDFCEVTIYAIFVDRVHQWTFNFLVGWSVGFMVVGRLCGLYNHMRDNIMPKIFIVIAAFLNSYSSPLPFIFNYRLGYR